MFLNTKTYIVLVYCLVISISLVGQRTAILESQSVYVNHTMDNRWLAKSQSFGLDAQIYPYSFLDNTCLIEDAEIIIVASSVMPMTTAQVNNLAQFVSNGGNLYLQGEWDFNLPGNDAFKQVTTFFGDTFNWKDSIKIQLAPIQTDGPLTNNYNSVSSLTYFWSGATSTFTGPFQSILSKGGNNYGLIYSPTQPHAGKVMTISDQDWLRLGLSDNFFENMLQYLIEELPNTPDVFITTADENICLGMPIEFNTQITGETEDLIYQWYLNGNLIPGANAANYTDTDLQEGDVITCEIFQDNICQQFLHLSNPILIAPIFPIDQSNIEIAINQLDSCSGGVINFDLTEINPDNIEIVSYEWTLNGFSLGNTNSQTLAIKDLSNTDVLTCSFLINDPCLGTVWLSSEPHNVNIYESINPTLTFVDPITSFCINQIPEYTIAGNGWGNTPQITWLMDGIVVQNGGASLLPSNIIAGPHTVQVTLASSEECVQVAELTQSFNFVLEEDIEMNATIVSTQPEICEGEGAEFSIDGINLGDQPQITWKVDGVIQVNTDLIFYLDLYQSGLIITAEINSAHPCVEGGMLELTAPVVTVLPNSIPNIAVDANPMKVCPGAEVTLQASGNYWGENPHLEWYVNGDISAYQGTEISFIPEQNSTVQLRVVSNYECLENPVVVSELMEIEVSDLAIEMISITPEHCNQQDGSINLNVSGGIGAIAGQWIDGTSTPVLENLSSGNYSYLATDEIGCESSYEVDVPFADAPEIEDILIQQPQCDQPFGQAQLLMPATDANIDIIWMDAQLDEVAEGSNVSNLVGGTYLVEVMDDFGCMTEANIEIEEVKSVELAPAEVMEIELGESVSLEPLVFSTDTDLEYQWESNENIDCADCVQLKTSPLETTRYYLTVKNSFGCTASTEFLVRVKKEYDIYMPTAFSPNADGRNDQYMVFAGQQVAAIESLSIFNRWGELVFQIDEPLTGEANDGWNGMYQGKKAPVGTYIVVAEISYKDGEKKVQSSELHLLR